MSKTERQAAVDDLAARIKASPTMFVTDFTGLDVLAMTDLRRRLRANGARYVVVKNTLAQRALADNDISALDEHLTGQTGLVFAGEDPLAAARVTVEFAREHEKPALRAGWMDGKLVESAYITRLGSIPPRETLLGQLLGGFNSILYQMVGALEALRDQRQDSGQTS
jgi:large subunit ribosomal protein L10